VSAAEEYQVSDPTQKLKEYHVQSAARCGFSKSRLICVNLYDYVEFQSSNKNFYRMAACVGNKFAVASSD
jgi:hypothetical protein